MTDYPATIANLAFWLDGRQPAYSDAGGTVLATAFSGQALRVNQPSPLSGNLQSGALAASPYVETNALNFVGDAGRYLSFPSGTAMVSNAMTLAGAFTNRDTVGVQDLLITYDTVNVNGVQLFQNPLSFDPLVMILYVQGVQVATSPVSIPAGAQVEFAWTVSSTTWVLSLVVNGVRASDMTGTGTFAAHSLLPASSWVGIQHGIDTTNGPHGAVAQVVGVARACTGTEITNLLAFFAANRAAKWAPTQIPLVIPSGDSIARGYLIDNKGDSWAYKMLAGLNAVQPVNMINTAITSHTIAQAVADYPTLVLAAKDSARAKHVLVAAIGTNTIALDASVTGAQLVAQYRAYIAQARSDTFRPVGHTILARLGTGHDAAFATAALYFNTDIRANYLAYGCVALADAAAIPQAADPSNTTYFIDGVHPTITLHALMAQVYGAATQVALDWSPAPTVGKPLTIERVLDWEVDPSIYLFSLKNSP